jgi:hypothetical protein
MALRASPKSLSTTALLVREDEVVSAVVPTAYFRVVPWRPAAVLKLMVMTYLQSPVDELSSLKCWRCWAIGRAARLQNVMRYVERLPLTAVMKDVSNSSSTVLCM